MCKCFLSVLIYSVHLHVAPVKNRLADYSPEQQSYFWDSS